MTDSDSGLNASRRKVLKSATIGAASMALVGNAAAGHGGHDGDEWDDEDQDEHYDNEKTSGEPGETMVCGYTNPVAGQGFVFPDHHDICAADHPETKALKEACRYSLDHGYPDVPTLIAQGFIPYFDIASVGGFSHWLHPGHINNPDIELDPGRPETILINNNTYCAQGVMFIPDQESAGHEPPVYITGNPRKWENGWIYPKRERRYEGVESQYTETGKGLVYANKAQDAGQDYYDDYDRTYFDAEEYEDDGTICAPWHRHTDGAARFAWWYNRQFHEGAALEDDELQFWCIVPGMFHVWPGAPEESMEVYYHDSPSNNRTGKKVCRGGYEDLYGTDDEDGLNLGNGELTMDDLPESVQQKAMPDDIEYELEILSDFDDATLYQMTVGEIKDLVRYDG